MSKNPPPKALKLGQFKKRRFFATGKEVKNTAGTVNGEGESQKPSNMPLDLISIRWKTKAGSIWKAH